jgi:uncharacterized protein
LGTGACEFGGGPGAFAELQPDAPVFHEDSGSSHKDSSTHKDGSSEEHDGGSAGSDAGSGSAGATAHLLITEISLNPDAGAFVEIYNPTSAAIDLTNYYLTNNGMYYTWPGTAADGGPDLPREGWIVQFPAGDTIAVGQVITVAVDGASVATNFMTTYSVAPTYSLTDTVWAQDDTDADGDPGWLDYNGNAVVLFYWNGTTDLVQDVDIMIAGNPSSDYALVNKSGLTSGSGATTYATDAFTIAAQLNTPGDDKSTKRLKFETGYETQNGTGNGITGHDETSENTAETWDTGSFTAPTPGTVPAPL